MVVSIETGETFEDIVIRTRSLLPLLGAGTVIPGIVDQNLEIGVSQCDQMRLLIGQLMPPSHWSAHLAVMEADAEDEVVCLDPGHDGLHLPLPAPRHLIVCPAQVSPARELPVEIFVINIMPSPGLTPIRVDGGHQMDVS